MARAGAADGSWLFADQQSAGRGRQGRHWTSPRGNVYASGLVRLRPSDPVAASLALVAGIAVVEALKPLTPEVALRLKWPNDILVGDAKLAGILLEREGDCVVVGIGINIVTHPDLPDRPTTSLAALGVGGVSTRAVVEALAAQLSTWVDVWRSSGVTAINHAWETRAHPLGTALSVHISAQERIAGAFDGLDSTGALRLRLANGSVSVIHTGDVFLV